MKCTSEPEIVYILTSITYFVSAAVQVTPIIQLHQEKMDMPIAIQVSNFEEFTFCGVCRYYITSEKIDAWLLEQVII